LVVNYMITFRDFAVLLPHNYIVYVKQWRGTAKETRKGSIQVTKDIGSTVNQTVFLMWA